MFAKVFLTGLFSMIAVLLLEQYIILTREPAVVQCDGDLVAFEVEDWIDGIEAEIVK